jgi:hypothetical protein
MRLISSVVFAGVLAVSSLAHADQPKMEAALASLQQAKESLKDASQDKGGYRGKALKAIQEAIDNVKAGMEWDRTHQNADEKAKK